MILEFIKRVIPYKVKVYLANRMPNIRSRTINILGGGKSTRNVEVQGVRFFQEFLVKTISEVKLVSDPKKYAAVFSPGIETNSGIAWYTHKLISESVNGYFFHWYSTSTSKFLEKDLDLDLLGSNFLVLPIEAFNTRMIDLFNYEHLVYMLGNGETHNQTFEIAHKHPGTIVIHDLKVSSVQVTAIEAPKVKEDFAIWKFPKTAKKYVFHSKFSLEYFKLHSNVTNKECVLSSLPPPSDIKSLKRITDPQLVATYGFIGYDKEPLKVLEVFINLSNVWPNSEFAFVGPIDDALRNIMLTRWEKAFGSSAKLTITDEVTRETWLDYMSRTKLAIQLRTNTNGESSATISELSGVGVPTVVTNIGAFIELDDGLFLKTEKNENADSITVKIVAWPGLGKVNSNRLREWSRNFSYRSLAALIFNNDLR